MVKLAAETVLRECVEKPTPVGGMKDFGELLDYISSFALFVLMLNR